ncbi:MAG TPA: DUF4166 domain-containing protein [Steroidobacteraceae bacterium]|jgi:uncharacterized protein DUF4166|nr:DUF4166 domain-containing protein [Steroidobacteraceae bacterium]HJY39901.1 DUF4166 domain-containing protein [Steroidobacteraceae bacterium]
MIATSVHAQVLGSSFKRLPPLLRSVHDTRARKEFSGRCSVESGRSWLARAIQLFASLPRRSQPDVPVHVVIERSERGETSESRETWTRRFGEQRMQSTIRDGRGALEEVFGPIVLRFALTTEADRIVWTLAGAKFLFLPLPAALFAGCGAFETIVDGRYWFDARAHIAGIGLLVHYKGWLAEHGG